jgi:hypothetical protein
MTPSNAYERFSGTLSNLLPCEGLLCVTQALYNAVGEEIDRGKHETFFGVISEETRITLETLFRRRAGIKLDESK